LEAFLYEMALIFEVFSNIQDKNLKIKKPIAVDVLIKAFPMAHSHADLIWPLMKKS
jgi:hypothetical protein